MTRIAPYGSWNSPITAEIAARAAITFSGVIWDNEDLYWLENRPAESGRSVLVRRTGSGEIVDVTPQGFNVRSRVHEYGGAACAIHRSAIFFVNLEDQRVYRQDHGSRIHPITSESACRYADLTIDFPRRRLICVREDHSRPGEPANTIAAIAMDGTGCRVLVAGNDFYSNPRLSPRGDQMAYLTWNHPNMPWDGCELRLVDVAANGSVGPSRLVAGGPDEAVFQPEWSPGGALHYISDRTGWWNLYQWTVEGSRPLCARPAEFGRAQWAFGESTYAFASERRILSCYTESGIDHLAWIESATADLEPIAAAYTKFDFVRCGPGSAAFIAGAPALPTAVVELDLRTGQIKVVRSAFTPEFDAAYLSPPQPIEWTTADERMSHGIYYAPASVDFAASPGEGMPLLLLCHSGPTSSASPSLRLGLQFWTSRGIAVLDVNYAGSTGYGRAYRRLLYGQWGVLDVEDCCSGAIAVSAEMGADPARMAVRGSSAGGYSALACVTSRNDVFAAASALYPIADLELLAKGSHKFESLYHARLIGPYPEQRDLYISRSPIHHADALRCPLILFHGQDDRVVPLEQSLLIFEAARRKGLPAALIEFAGEGHGFRRAETLRRVLEAELSFFSRALGFRFAGALEAVPIANMPPAP